LAGLHPPSGFATDIDFLHYHGSFSGLHPPSGLAPDIDYRQNHPMPRQQEDQGHYLNAQNHHPQRWHPDQQMNNVA
jgi:hypothetical protein